MAMTMITGATAATAATDSDMRGRFRWGWRFWVPGAVLIALGVWIASTWIRQPYRTAVMRGANLALRMGCFGCHGPGGNGGIANPGAEEGEIPAWNGGTLMMYVERPAEVGEWIRFGRPKRLWKDGRPPEPSPGPPVAMPAYGPWLSDQELDDLTAYVMTVGAYGRKMSADAQQGYEVATRLGCFGCHGPGGRGGGSNPGAFKEYIPPWEGDDFKELVQDDRELRQWILEGRIDRFEAHPIARYFTRRQLIRMPAYGPLLKDGELDALVAYIRSLDH